MKKITRKILAVALSLMLIISIVPMGVFNITASAATSGYYTYTVSNGKATITDVDTSISGNVTIPSTLGGYPVTGIGEFAFSDCSNLTNITIPDSVKSIENGAFYNCTSITSMTIPFIGSSRDANQTEDAVFGYIFGCTSSPFAINQHYTYKSDGSAYYHIPSSLESVTITDDTTIPYGAFYNCGILTNITIPDDVTSIGNCAFYNCTRLTSINMPNSITSIGSSTFYNCIRLTSITIPDTITSIDYNAFYNCTSLENVYITDLSAWCGIDFYNSHSNPMNYANNIYIDGKFMTSVTIPDGVTKIKDYSFCGFDYIIKITIPDSVVNIGEFAFAGCDNLTNITIPDSVTSIGEYAFSGCTSLTNIIVPDSVISLGNYAFRNCTNLESVAIGDSVTSIGDGVFYYCSNLKNITIPNSVKTIGESSFYNCTSLTSMTIPFIGSSRDANETYSAVFGYIFGSESSSITGTTEQFYKNSDSSYYYIPKSLKSVTITDDTTIPYGAFYNCNNITNITLPECVTSIGGSAFKYCTGIENVYIADIAAWCGVTFGSSSANPMCYANNVYLDNQILTDVVLPIGTEITNQYTFYNCKSIEDVFIPKSMLLIKENAFYNCSGIKNIYYEGSPEEWEEVTILSGNDYLENATVCYNSTGIPSGIISVEITKLPNKLQYIENEEKLDLTGGVLTVNYDGGATQDIELATLNVEGFDNTKLGKQVLTVNYDEFSATLEVEIITKPISFVAVSKLPDKTSFALGDALDLTGGKIAVGYLEGNFEIFDITDNMVTGYDCNKLGVQVLTVTYKGYTDQLVVTVYEKIIGDADGDGLVDENDLKTLALLLLNSGEYNEMLDMNSDGKIDVIDGILLRKKIGK